MPLFLFNHRLRMADGRIKYVQEYGNASYSEAPKFWGTRLFQLNSLQSPITLQDLEGCGLDNLRESGLLKKTLNFLLYLIAKTRLRRKGYGNLLIPKLLQTIAILKLIFKLTQLRIKAKYSLK